MPIVLRLLAASNLAYETGGPVSTSPYAAIAQLQGCKTFTRGIDRINSALVGTADFGVVVAFRGTLPPNTNPDPLQTIRDWVQDLECELDAGAKLPGLVHHGFLGALDSLWPDLAPEVSGQLQAAQVKKLFVTGHSKGGSMAHLAAARFAMTSTISGNSICVRTFEGAMPGNDDFASSYARLVPDATRFEYQDDVVPHLPPSVAGRALLRGLPGFEHVVALTDDFSYAHAGVLSFVDWQGNLVPDSPFLRLERNFRLGQQLATGGVKQVIRDHAIDTTSVLWEVIKGAAI
ncbi:lipase family protein [Roseateles sp.]|uniref:lipase family protein n=1 Tax=Roseateles sp. TaxID=1971397 RepID=UPI0025D40612|nr:lipase family protein [Roseateles sp.]MBV8037128.1 lipase family protein [Roseateles sp.]